MRSQFLSLLNVSYGKLRMPLLIFTWACGLLLGALIAILFSTDSVIILQTAILTSAPFLLVIFINALPIVLISYCISRKMHYLSYLLIFMEAICLSFCGIIPVFVFNDSAWLIRCLFHFSGSCTSVLMWWLIYRNIQCREEHLHQDIIFASILILIISVIDVFYISPFLFTLSKYF